MIGYYVHHVGRGHLARATAIARASGRAVTGLSSLPRPDDWPGPWVELPLDDADASHDVDAHGRLHWVPVHAYGLRERAAAVSAWIAAARPAAFVVDVSVEIALLARLHGIPVVAFALPGDRTDAAHELGFDIATTILAAWPPGLPGLDDGLPPRVRHKLVAVGAIGRLEPAPAPPAPDRTPPRVLVLGGAGGDDFRRDRLEAARDESPRWSWKRLGGTGEWVADVGPPLREAAIVVTHAGEGALADVSAARRPAIVIPQRRPHAEQHATARVLRSGGLPALVLDDWPDRGWDAILARALELDGRDWMRWNDGGGARRASVAIDAVARGDVR